MLPDVTKPPESSSSSSRKTMRRAVLPLAPPNETLFGIRNAVYARDILAFRNASPPEGSTSEKDFVDSMSDVECEWIIGNVPLPPKPLAVDIRLPTPPLLRVWLAVNDDQRVRLELCETIRDPDIPVGLSKGIGGMPIPIPGISKRSEAFCPAPDSFLQVKKEGEWVPESDFSAPQDLPYPPWHYRTFYPPTTSTPASATVSDTEAQEHPPEENEEDHGTWSDRRGASHRGSHHRPRGGGRGQPRREEPWSANQQGRGQRRFSKGRGGAELGSWERRGSHRRGFQASGPSHRDGWGSRDDRRQQPDGRNEEEGFHRRDRHFEERRGRQQRGGHYRFNERNRNPDGYGRHPETHHEQSQRNRHRYDEGRNGKQQRFSGHRSKGWNEPSRREDHRIDEQNRFPEQEDHRIDEHNRFPDQGDRHFDKPNRFSDQRDHRFERNRFPDQRNQRFEERTRQSHWDDHHTDEWRGRPDRRNDRGRGRRGWPDRRNDGGSRGWNRQSLTKPERSEMPSEPFDDPSTEHGEWQRKWNEEKGWQDEHQDELSERPHRRNNRFQERQSTWPDASNNDADHPRHADRSSFNSHRRDQPTFTHSRQRSPRGRVSFQRGGGRNENRNRSPRRPRPDFDRHTMHPSESDSGWHQPQEDQWRRTQEVNEGEDNGERREESPSHVKNTEMESNIDLQEPRKRPPDVHGDNRRPYRRNARRPRGFQRKPQPRLLSYPNAVPVGQAPSHSPRDEPPQRRTEDRDGNQEEH